MHFVIRIFQKREATRSRILNKCLFIWTLALVEQCLLSIQFNSLRQAIVTHSHNLKEFYQPLSLVHIGTSTHCLPSL